MIIASIFGLMSGGAVIMASGLGIWGHKEPARDFMSLATVLAIWECASLLRQLHP